MRMERLATHAAPTSAPPHGRLLCLEEAAMHVRQVRGFAALALLLMTAPAVAAARTADASGCSDPAGLKRFEGSSLVLCERRDFAEYALPTGKAVQYDFDTKRASFEASLSLEGRLVQSVYAVPLGPSAAEVFRNYEAELATQGFRLLFEAKQADAGPALGSYFEGIGPGTQIWGYSPDEARYAAAVKEDGGARTYAALYVVEYQDGYDPEFSPQKGQAIVRLDVLQAGAIADRMVMLSAAEIAKGLAAEGKVALDGVTFDFNQATIKPQSRPTLDEIAKFLREHAMQDVYVIGHTDDQGGFEFNMRLSNARAEAIAADLARTYGIRAERITVVGVGLLAPVAPNTTEAGRAKNRRVELLPR